MIIDCTGLNKVDVLISLYENSGEIGLGCFQSSTNTLNHETAELLSLGFVDYLNGRPIKIWFTDYPIIDVERYDEYNGEGNAFSIIQNLKNISKGSFLFNNENKNFNKISETNNQECNYQDSNNLDYSFQGNNMYQYNELLKQCEVEMINLKL